MPKDKFQSVLLHTLPDAQGWQIIGIKPDGTRELIAAVTPPIQEHVARLWAHSLAQELAGKPEADID